MTLPNPTPPHGQDELLPCAHCGGAPVIKQAGKTKYWWVGCEIHLVSESRGCGVGFSSYDKQVAISKWNTRVPIHPPAPTTLNEEQLRGALERVKGELLITLIEDISQFKQDVKLLLHAASRVADYQPGLKALLEVNEELRKENKEVMDLAARQMKQFAEAIEYKFTLTQERDQLLARVKELEKDKERLDWAESHRVQLNCSMGALGNFHYQVGSWPSEHCYRAAIDKQIERIKTKELEQKVKEK